MAATLRSCTRLWALLLAVAGLGLGNPVYASSPEAQYQSPACVDAAGAGVAPDGADLFYTLAVDAQDDDDGERKTGRRHQEASCLHASVTPTSPEPEAGPVAPQHGAGADLPVTSIYLVTARLRL